MARRRHTPEQIITKLREAEVGPAQGHSVARACKVLEVTGRTWSRWRMAYGGMKVAQARRLKQLAQRNSRLRRAVAGLTAASQILREAAERNLSARQGAGRASRSRRGALAVSERHACKGGHGPGRRGRTGRPSRTARMPSRPPLISWECSEFWPPTDVIAIRAWWLTKAGCLFPVRRRPTAKGPQSELGVRCHR